MRIIAALLNHPQIKLKHSIKLIKNPFLGLSLFAKQQNLLSLF